MTDISEIVRELKRYAAGHAGPVSPCCQRAADALERFSGRETDGDVKHWIDLLTEGKAVLDSYEMRDLAAVLSRLSAKLETWKLAAHTAEDEVSRLSADTASTQAELAIVKDILLNPNPDDEPDVIRLHREKCDMFERALAAEARLAEAVELLQSIFDHEAADDSLLLAIQKFIDGRNGPVGTPLEGAK